MNIKSNLSKAFTLAAVSVLGFTGPAIQQSASAATYPSYPGVLVGRGIQHYSGDLKGYTPGVAGLQHVKAWSHSMRRYIPLEIVIPNNKPATNAPIVYLVNGADGGEGTANWSHQTNWVDFFANKGAVVVQVMQGAGSYYTNWIADDPKAGRQKWETFLLHEVEDVLEPHLGVSPKKRGLIGYSMSTTSVFNLQIARPGFYKAVHAYSGCPEVYAQMPRLYATYIVQVAINNSLTDPNLPMPQDGSLNTAGSITRMWGDANNPLWRLKDPVMQAAKLRGTDMYIYSGTGDAGIHDVAGDKTAKPTPDGGLYRQITVGGQLESRGHECTVHFVNKLRRLGIPIHANINHAGTHSWGYWIDAMNESWPLMARSIGAKQDGVKMAKAAN